MLNEDETKARLITPLLHECGWSEEYIRRERHFTDGRIFVTGDRAQRLERKRYDYLLCCAGTYPIAVVEAKEQSNV